MKIAAIQMCSGLDPEANLAALKPLLAEAAAAGAAYALTPEVTMIFPENRDQLKSVAAPFEDHPQLAAVGKLAKAVGSTLGPTITSRSLTSRRFCSHG